MNPVHTQLTKTLMDALKRDPGLLTAISDLINPTLVQESIKEREPGWPGAGAIIRAMERSEDFFVNWLMKKAKNKLNSMSDTAVAAVDHELDQTDDRGFVKLLDEEFEMLLEDLEGPLEEDFLEQLHEAYEGLEEERDPYGYRGLSRRDFLASRRLRKATIKLAHEVPELRKHLLPLLKARG